MKSPYVLLYSPFGFSLLTFRGSKAQELIRAFTGIKQINVDTNSPTVVSYFAKKLMLH